MVLLGEKPHHLFTSVQENFVIDGDTAQLVRISGMLSTLRDSRRKAQNDQQVLVRTLARSLNAAKQTHDEAVKAHAAAAFSDRAVALDRKKFALAKGLNDIESSTHSLEGQLAKLREQLETLDAEDPLEKAVVEEADAATTLKLHVFRSLGIELQEDGAGGYSKAIVRNPAKGEFNVVNLEEKKWTRNFYVNYFWDLI